MSPHGGPDAHVLVVAGATGTGKSTVCRWLAQRGAFVLEADRVGHEVLARPEVAARLRARFGDQVVPVDGSVDRRKLGELVFGDASALRELDAIVHPPLVAELVARIQRLRGSRAVELIVVDAALHFQFQPPLACDAVLATDAPAEVQQRRIMERDGLTAPQALARMQRQAEVKQSVALADHVLRTDRPPAQVRAELLATVDRLLGLDLAATDMPSPA
jgi:dephospho-CoA kinase